MSNPPDKPGRLAIIFFDDNDHKDLLVRLIAVAAQQGYMITDRNTNAALLERGY